MKRRGYLSVMPPLSPPNYLQTSMEEREREREKERERERENDRDGG